jgi:hypothetical protein
MVRCGLPAPFIVLHHPDRYAALWEATEGGRVPFAGGVPSAWRIPRSSWRRLLDRPDGEAVALALGYGLGMAILGGGVDPLGPRGPLRLWAAILAARAALRAEERAQLAAWGAFVEHPQNAANRPAVPLASLRS